VTPTDWVLLIVGVLGFAAVGSFTCVIIDRLPLELDEPNKYGELWDTRPWGQVFGGTSRCSSCGAAVRARDNIPVLGWLLLRGKCRDCGERIPGFHPVVELVCPLLFLFFVWQLGASWPLLPALWLVPVGVAISAIDLRTLIVPTRIIWPAFFVSVALCVVVAGIEGEWAWLLSGLVGIAVLAGPLFVIWFVRPQGMGFGDVRLSVLLGWNVGFFAGTPIVGSVLLAVICMALSALVGIVYGVVAMGVRGRGAKVPFGPALVAAALFCIAMAGPVLEPFSL
jgi:leader peptidase (prepilin peptidase)/N-methyltransferase